MDPLVHGFLVLIELFPRIDEIIVGVVLELF